MEFRLFLDRLLTSCSQAIARVYILILRGKKCSL